MGKCYSLPSLIFLSEVNKILNHLPISNSTSLSVSFMVFILFFKFPEFNYAMLWCSFLWLYHYWDSLSFLNLRMCFSSHRNFGHYFLKLVFCFIISLYFGPPVSCIKDLLILNQAYWSLSSFCSQSLFFREKLLLSGQIN